MNIRQITLSIVAIISAIHVSAQTSTYKVDLPQVLPASPEAFSFVKSGIGNSNLSTGAATASIPLYTIKLKDYAFPISLAYSTQGLKADEVSTRVGLGWVLNANAMITRSVKGAPDEQIQRLTIPSSNTEFETSTDAMYNWYLQSVGAGTGSGYDSQPDEFQFNCNGYSGKFVLDMNNIPRITSTSNVNIVKNGDLFVLTTPDGVVYRFGGASEITSNHSFGKLTAYKQIKTAFFLDRIDLPTGEYILFNYTPISFHYDVGITQTAQVVQSITPDVVSCAVGNMNSYTTSYDNVSYNSNYLNSITTSNGLTINLTYGGRPDASGDNRLNGLEVIGIKKYAFEYFDVPNPGSQPTGRFFLTKLRDITAGTGATQSLDHEFTYEQLSNVPLPVTFNQDYLGFYNGTNFNYLIPNNILANTTVDFSFRNPNWSYSKIGTLTAIKYPTGGSEAYTYEMNTTKQLSLRNTNASYSLQGPGGGSAGSASPLIYTNNFVTVPFDQNVTLNTFASDADPNDGFTADPTHVSVIAWIYEGATLISSRSALGYTPSTTTVSLLAGHTYQLKMQVNSYTETGNAAITYNSIDHPVYDTTNVQIPGVRLRQITYTDPFTSSSHSKYYTYAALNNLKWSSGSATAFSFSSSSANYVYCNQNALVGLTVVSIRTYSSSSTGQAYGYIGSGSVIYYNTVIESDDPLFVNGGTQYTFYPNDNGLNQNLVHGGEIPFIPGGQYPTLSGMVYQTTVFNKNRQNVRFEQNDYETIIDPSHLVSSVYVRQNWDPTPIAFYATYQDARMGAFDAVRSDYGSYWIRKTGTTIITDGLSQATSFVYGTPLNILPASTTTTDSQGNTLTTTMVYPNTYGGSDQALTGYSALSSKNIITPVVQQSASKNGTLLQQKKIFYNDWFGNQTIITPQKIQVMESASDVLHDVLSYTSYSSAGNPLQVQKLNDVQISYLWDEKLSLPIAEVRNAALGQIAFSGFENGAYGNWTLQAGYTITNTAFTGVNGFTGTVQKAISLAGIYTVTLWTTGTSPTVNSAAGTLMKSITLNAITWNLYQWSLTNPSTVTVAGTNIDEVRLCPAGSLMDTYTYKPFVGLIAKCDDNNTAMYYSYDVLGRLIAAADHKGNILKTFEYYYQK